MCIITDQLLEYHRNLKSQAPDAVKECDELQKEDNDEVIQITVCKSEENWFKFNETMNKFGENLLDLSCKISEDLHLNSKPLIFALPLKIRMIGLLSVRGKICTLLWIGQNYKIIYKRREYD